MGVSEVQFTNDTSRCRSFSVHLSVKGRGCRSAQIPGFDPDCEKTCAAVLFKGTDARRVPISVRDEMELGVASAATLRIDDK